MVVILAGDNQSGWCFRYHDHSDGLYLQGYRKIVEGTTCHYPHRNRIELQNSRSKPLLCPLNYIRRSPSLPSYHSTQDALISIAHGTEVQIVQVGFCVAINVQSSCKRFAPCIEWSHGPAKILLRLVDYCRQALPDYASKLALDDGRDFLLGRDRG